MELNDGAFAASKSPKAAARGGEEEWAALRHLPHYSHLKRAFWWEQCADGRRISGVPKKGFKPPKCCHRSDSSSLPQTPSSVLPCLVQPCTAGLHWNVVSFLLSFLLYIYYPTIVICYCYCYCYCNISCKTLFSYMAIYFHLVHHSVPHGP